MPLAGLLDRWIPVSGRPWSPMNGTTVVVTGAADSVGRAVTTRVIDRGATVVLGDRDGDRLDELVADHDGSVTGVRTNVRDEFDVERLMETASRFGESGGIDVVVAADAVRHGSVGSTPLDEESYTAFDDHMRTNARGVFATIVEASAHLNADARLLVPTEPAARESTPGSGSYAVSRAAAEAVVRGFAADLPQTVSAVDVGALGATGEPIERSLDDVASLFVWAATDAEAPSIDGSVVRRDAPNATS